LKNIVGIKFKKEGKIYHFHASDLPVKMNDQVIVHTDSGPALGVAATEVRGVSVDSLPENLKDVLRVATEADLKNREDIHSLEDECRIFCGNRIRERNLPMKLINVECLFDRSKVIFYFTADNRVDFRELVKDLVQKFKTRIELRQIGARHEARIVKGLAICGREVCCANLLMNLDRVSVKMAKEQSMSLNPEKISGLCGRLMCCLAFEYETYAEIKKHLPKCGKVIQIEQGTGKVVRQNILGGEVTVEMEDGKEVTVKMTDL
jgi:cell fate regulator YaaT (PSP1 superfamily)